KKQMISFSQRRYSLPYMLLILRCDEHHISKLVLCNQILRTCKTSFLRNMELFRHFLYLGRIDVCDCYYFHFLRKLFYCLCVSIFPAASQASQSNCNLTAQHYPSLSSFILCFSTID